MYSYEDRLRAVKLLIQYDLSAAAVIRELGYPDRHSIMAWYKEYIAHGDLHKESSRSSKFTDEQRIVAIQYYLDHGKSKSRTIKALGYPSRALLTEWIKQEYPDEVRPCTKGQSLVHLTKEQKEQAAIELCTRDGSAQEIAERYNVSRYSVYNWAWNLLGKGNVSPMSKKKSDTTAVTQETVDSLKQEIEQLHNEAEALKHQVYRLQLEKDVLEKAAEILKKDEGVSLEKLTNREKAIVIGALRSKYKLHELLDVFHMAKSSYCYQQAVLNAPDKYADLRAKIRVVFDESSSRYGYRRIYNDEKDTRCSRYRRCDVYEDIRGRQQPETVSPALAVHAEHVSDSVQHAGNFARRNTCHVHRVPQQRGTRRRDGIRHVGPRRTM